MSSNLTKSFRVFAQMIVFASLQSDVVVVSIRFQCINLVLKMPEGGSNACWPRKDLNRPNT